MKVQEIITNDIIDMLSEGTIPWDKPFNGVSPRNIRGTGYRGINLLILGTQGFTSPYWLTFNQCRGLGGKVIKGSKGTKIVFWKWVKQSPDFDPDETDPVAQGIGDKAKYPILRYYTVFNLDQTEGIPEEKIPAIPELESRGNDWDPILEAQKFIRSIPDIDIRYSHIDIAFYDSTQDYIQIPEPKYFASPEGYYSTQFHEIGHWTGHKDRLNRDLKGLRESKHSYSFEELIAELTSAFLCARFGLLKSTVRNHAGYIQSWIQALKNDPAMIIKASSRAQKALDYILEIADESGANIPEPVQNAA